MELWVSFYDILRNYGYPFLNVAELWVCSGENCANDIGITGNVHDFRNFGPDYYHITESWP